MAEDLNGWQKYQVFVLEGLKRLETAVTAMDGKIDALHNPPCPVIKALEEKSNTMEVTVASNKAGLFWMKWVVGGLALAGAWLFVKFYAGGG